MVVQGSRIQFFKKMLTMETMLLVGTAVAIVLIPSVRADCIGCSVDYKCGASISKICCKLPATSKPQPYIYFPAPPFLRTFFSGGGWVQRAPALRLRRGGWTAPPKKCLQCHCKKIPPPNQCAQSFQSRRTKHPKITAAHPKKIAMQTA